MSFKDLELSGGYDSGIDHDILNTFYIPVLKEAVSYKRLAGFFSSSSLAIAARGISGLIKNGGHVQMVVSPRLTKEDVAIMEKAETNPDEIISNVMLKEIDDIEVLMHKKHVEALGWLMANGLLELKVATVYNSSGKLMTEDEIENSSLFHIKVGVLEDAEGNIISFSGSINETAAAWKHNVEEFKVFKSWEEGNREALSIDINKFESYWNPNDDVRVKVSDIPNAVKSNMIASAPTNFEKLEKEIVKEQEKIDNECVNRRLNFKPFEYQDDALKLWVNNGQRAIFEMATGTGKTKTAELCIDYFLEQHDGKPKVVIIACPQDTLAKQWKKDIEESGLDCSNCVVADSTSSNWKSQLEESLAGLGVERAGRIDTLFVYVTFDTFCKNSFISRIVEHKNDSIYFLIGDEVHGLGSSERSSGLLDAYDVRLGLSATPDRWCDEFGTNILNMYFSSARYQFTIEQALTTINPYTHETYLTPYEYKPKFVSLTEEEIEKYKALTFSIIRKMNRAKKDKNVQLQMEQLCFMRADIHKSASAKLDELENLLDEFSESGKEIKDTIIFVSPGQIGDVISILAKRHIRFHEYTKDQSQVPEARYNYLSEREHIIDLFKSGDYQILVAIKCLDEGIDIPSADTAIIMASSTNPREYIQRIGRIIRRSPGKKKAWLYDMIVEPSFDTLEPELARIERSIFEKEMVRIKDISENASNRLEIIDAVYDRLL